MPGIRQKLALDTPDRKLSNAGEYLSTLYSTGRLTANEVASGAAAVTRDIDEPPAHITQLASAASSKTRPKRAGGERDDTRNCARDLTRTIKRYRATKPVDVVMIPVPQWNAQKGMSEPRNMAFCLPHLLLDSIPEGDEHDYCNFPAEKQTVKSDLTHWCARMGVDANTGPPIAACGLWGDGADFTTRDSLNLLILTVLSSRISVRWWVCAFAKSSVCRCGCLGRHTFDCIFKIIGWSFGALLTALHPRVDFEGHPHKDGSVLAKLAASGRPLRVRAALLRKMGDWAWHKQVLGLTGWRGEGPEKRVCWMCKATLGRVCPCWDFSANARWRNTCIDMANFWASLDSRAAVSAIWCVPGFILPYIIADWMHVCCLGVAQYTAGCIMYEFFFAAPWIYASFD